MKYHKVFLSNKIETLFLHIKEQLFVDTSPFAKRIVIVPSPALKTWLQLQAASDPELSIAAGFEILTLAQGFNALANLFQNEKSAQKTIPSALELALAIESEIKKIVRKNDQADLWKPLFDYLKISENSLSRKGERRLIQLSNELASLFNKYGHYGDKMVEKWATTELTDWQQALWNRIYHTHYPCSYQTATFHEILSQTSSHSNLHVHLFGVSFLSSAQHNFLQNLAETIPVNYYLISPCRAFWLDIRSDRETAQLRYQWKKQRISEAKQIALDEFLRDRNPLLANFGRLGREMASQVEESQSESLESYSLSSTIAQQESYAELVDHDISLEKTNKAPTLLEYIQADLLLLRNPEKSQKISLSSKDNSLQLHVASSPQREVEILYNNLLAMIAEKEHPLRLSDIIVMAPDIRKYESYIKSIFGSEESQLNFQLMDFHAYAENSLVQGFLFLINLAFSRWEASSIQQLIEYPEFQRKQKLSFEDLQQVRQWITETGIRWGKDPQHRQELLRRDHNTREMVGDGFIGSWDFGIERLLMGLAMIMDPINESTDHLRVIPFTVETTQAELLGNLIELLNSLRDDLKPLTDGTELTLSDWTHYLNALLESYFSIDVYDDQQVKFWNDLKSQIDLFRQSSQELPEEKFSFISIKNRLENLLQQETLCYKESHLNAIRFCSLLPMRAIPAKVVCLLGMNGESFPKIEQRNSLNRMVDNCDYCPTSLDYDRYLFLEILLSARENIIISYSSQNRGKQVDAAPSLVVTELLNYIDSAYKMGSGLQSCIVCSNSQHGEDLNKQTIQDRRPDPILVSARITTCHPFYSFDARYFSGNQSLKSFSKFDFKAAQSFYHQEKNPSHLFCQEFLYKITFPTKTKQFSSHIFDIKALADTAKNPIKTYFNHSLGIYIKSVNEENSDDDLFALSNLHKGMLRNASLTKSLDHLLSKAGKEGKLPTGMFKDLAEDKVRDDSEEIASNLKKMGLKDSSLMQIKLSHYCQKAEQTKPNEWMIPAIEVTLPDGLNLKLVGTLPHVCSEGLVIKGKKDAKDIVAAWPYYLILQHIRELPIKKQLLFTGLKKPISVEISFEEAQEMLKTFLQHYFDCQENLSLLIPELVLDIFNSDEEALEKKIAKYIEPDDYTHFYNNYARWSCLHGSLSKELVNEKWQSKSDALYGHVLRTLYSKKGCE